MENNNDITIRVQAVDDASGPLNVIMKKFDELGRITKEVTNKLVKGGGITEVTKSFQYAPEVFNTASQAAKGLGVTMQEVNKYMTDNALTLTQNGQVIDRITGKYVAMGNVVKQTAIKSRRFKMEWLSIMFAGMALTRTFGALLSTQMQLFGVTEMMANAWTVVLLPIMELISPILYKIIEAFMNMPEGMQLAIGAFIILMTVIGSVLSIVGQFMLGLGGLKMIAPGVFTAIKVAVGGLAASFGTILIVIGVLILAIAAIWYAWKTNFANIRTNFEAFWNGLKQAFKGLIGIVSGVLSIIKGLFTGDFTLIKEGIIKIFKGLFDMLLGAWKATVNLFAIILKSALMIIWNSMKAMVDGVIWALNKIIKFAGGKEISFKFPQFPSFKEGGIMPYTGLAMLHQGERIIPKNQVNSSTSNTNFSPTINLNANVSSSYDVRKLAGELNKYWANDFQRMVKK